MDWNPSLDRLLNLLADLYQTREAASSLAQRAGIPLRFVNLSGPAIDVWMSILSQAKTRGKLPALIAKATEDYPEVDFPALARQSEQPMPQGPRLDPADWKGPDIAGGTLEKLMGTQPTFLPIKFLEIGLHKARSVVRVVTPEGYGTGFLCRDNLLITNHHVIPSRDVARESKVEFNFQETVSGLAAPVARFDLDPGDNGFTTSPEEGGDDWTAVRVAGNPQADWPAIELAEAQVKASD
jgi:hypothetical protein